MKVILALVFIFSSSVFSFEGASQFSVGTTQQFRETSQVLTSEGSSQDFERNDPSINFSVESLLFDNLSWFAKGDLSFDLSVGNTEYFFFGGGMNYYWNQNSFANLKEESFSIYNGFQFGFSSINIYRLSTSLSVVSTGLELGPHIGTNYRLNEKWLTSAEFGYSFHYGFSSVAVESHSFRANFAISRQF